MENMSMENNIPFRLNGTPAEAVAEFMAEAARRIENQAAFIVKFEQEVCDFDRDGEGRARSCGNSPRNCD
jgi:hypothetical protein